MGCPKTSILGEIFCPSFGSCDIAWLLRKKSDGGISGNCKNHGGLGHKKPGGLSKQTSEVSHRGPTRFLGRILTTKTSETLIAKTSEVLVAKAYEKLWPMKVYHVDSNWLWGRWRGPKSGQGQFGRLASGPMRRRRLEPSFRWTRTRADRAWHWF